MNKILFLALLTAAPLSAFAQAIESEPLSPLQMPTYTQDVAKPPIGGTTDSPKLMQPIPNPQSVNDEMARDAANAPPERDVLPATPPPGPDSLPPQSDTAPIEAPVINEQGTTSPAGDTRPPAPVGAIPVGGSGFPNGKTPPDKDMSKRVFCTLKVTFAKSADAKIYDSMKNYIEANADIIRLESLKPAPGIAQQFCMMIDQHNKRARTYKDLRKFLPIKSRKESGVILSGEGFVPVTTRD